MVTMPSIRIVDRDRTIEMQDDDAGIDQLFVLASDAMDHRAQEGIWLPMAYRAQLAARQMKNDTTN